MSQTEEQPNPAANEAESQGEAAVKSEIDLLKEQLSDQQKKYLYLYAEFENFKKRAVKERSEILKFGHEGLAREILSVSDNLDRALEHTANLDALVTGIKMVNQQLRDALGKFGVTPVTSVGQKFDPERHEAVGQEKIAPHSEGQDEGVVCVEHQKGYTLHGRLLRPARVVVTVK